MKVLSVCFDAGPANNVGPVVECLRQRGIEAILFAGGPAASVLEKAGIEFLPYTTATAAIDACDQFDLFYGAIDCNSCLPSLEIILEMKERGIICPVYLQTDYWGSGIYRVDEWKQVTPDRVFCNDQRDAELAELIFPKMAPANALASGWPWLDAYKTSPSEIADMTKQAMEDLGIDPDEIVVFFAGQLNRTGKVFTELIEGIVAVDQPVLLIGRQHPAMLLERDQDEKWADERKQWKSALSKFEQWGKGRYLDCTGPNYNVQLLIAVSDVVVGAFTTTLIEASAWRKQTIAVLYPESGMQEWLDVTKGSMSNFPLCDLGACGYANDSNELVRLLRLAYRSRLDDEIGSNQSKCVVANGGNARRVADEIMRQIN